MLSYVINFFGNACESVSKGCKAYMRISAENARKSAKASAKASASDAKAAANVAAKALAPKGGAVRKQGMPKPAKPSQSVKAKRDFCPNELYAALMWEHKTEEAFKSAKKLHVDGDETMFLARKNLASARKEARALEALRVNAARAPNVVDATSMPAPSFAVSVPVAPVDEAVAAPVERALVLATEVVPVPVAPVAAPAASASSFAAVAAPAAHAAEGAPAVAAAEVEGEWVLRDDGTRVCMSEDDFNFN